MHAEDFVLEAGDPRVRDADAVGGKAASLASLCDAGFEVPPFCVISCAAYEQLSSQRDVTQLRPGVSAWLATRPEGARFAVRSSARGEDSAEHSFAGLYETILDVGGIDAVVSAVARCWDSYGGRAAQAYRERRQATAGAMAVVVQQMVSADWAGVAFSANPVTQALGEVVVNATPGLGDRLVSGEINPEEIRIDPASGSVISRVTPQATASLPADVLDLVWRQAKRVEQAFRFPQDIEWAAVGGKVYLLQSRPITTIADVWYSRYLEPWSANGEAKPDAPDRVWTRAYADEIWAPPVSPLFYNIHNLTPSFSSYWRWHGDKTALPPDVFKYYRATAYLDVEVLKRQYDYHPAFSRIAGILNFFPKNRQTEIRRSPWRWRGRLLRTYRFECEQRALRSIAHNHKTLAALWPGFVERTNRWFALDLEAMTAEELQAHRKELNETVAIVSPACGFAVAYHAHDLTFVLTGLLERWFGDGDRLYAEVTSGLDDSDTVEESESIWQLAQRLKAIGTRCVQQARDGATRALMQELAASPDGSSFLSAFDHFWLEHRHRGASYKDLVHPRWGDDKGQLLAVIGSAAASDSASPRVMNARMAEVRRSVQADLLARCRGRTRWRRSILRWLFRYNEIYMAIRDNHRFYFDRVWYQLRRIYRTYGTRLATAGVLGDSDDVFFLGTAEIEQGLGGTLDGAEARARVAFRQRVWNTTARVQAPKFLVGYCAMEDGRGNRDDATWMGIGASPGVVTGRVRVVFDVRELPTVQDGDILVTRQTDPAWSTVFSRIAGLVLETGGVLAHGASLCREFQLPCVTALERATQQFQDGERITVDGTRGRVFRTGTGRT